MRLANRVAQEPRAEVDRNFTLPAKQSRSHASGWPQIRTTARHGGGNAANGCHMRATEAPTHRARIVRDFPARFFRMIRCNPQPTSWLRNYSADSASWSCRDRHHLLLVGAVLALWADRIGVPTGGAVALAAPALR